MPCVYFFYGEGLLAPRPTPKLGEHPLSAVRDYLFNTFAATLHIWRSSQGIVLIGYCTSTNCRYISI